MSTFVWLGLGNLALAIPLAVTAWMSGKLLRRPAVTHGLWVLVLLKLVTPPLGYVPVGVIEEARVVEATEIETVNPAPLSPPGRGVGGEGLSHREDHVASQSELTPTPDATELADSVVVEVPAAVVGPPLTPDPSPQRGEGRAEAQPVAASIWTWNNLAIVLPAIGGLWLAGATFTWLRLLRSSLRFQRLLNEASPAPAELQTRVERLAAELGVRPPEVVFAPGAVSPLLWVWGRTASLVLPRALFEQLEHEQQSTLLVHELAHWKRGDHWVRRLECLAGGLYWWCPLAWWAQAGVRQAEEECCDAWVVATVPDSSRAYALALVETVDFLAGVRPLLPPLASGLGPFSSLQRRLTMIFRTGTHRRLSLMGLVGLVVLGGLMLSWSPALMTAGAQQQQQQQEGDNPRPKKKKDAPRATPDPERPVEQGRGEGVDRETLERLHAELQRRQEELEVMQMQLQRKTRELQALMDRTKAAEANREPDFKKPLPRPRADMKEGRAEAGQPAGGGAGVGGQPARGGAGVGGQPAGGGAGGGGPPNVERRMEEIERKLDMMMKAMEDMRRGMAGPGAAGRPGFGGGGGGAGFGGPGGPSGFAPGAPGGPVPPVPPLPPAGPRFNDPFAPMPVAPRRDERR